MIRFDVSWWKLLRGKIAGWALVAVVVLTLIFLEVVGYSDSAPGRHQLVRYAGAVLAILLVALVAYLASLVMGRATSRQSARLDQRYCLTNKYLKIDDHAITVPVGIFGKWVSIPWADVEARICIQTASGKRVTHLIIGRSSQDINRLAFPEAQFLTADDYQSFSATLDKVFGGLADSQNGRTKGPLTQYVVQGRPWVTWSICLALGLIILAQVLSGMMLTEGMFSTVTWGGMTGGGAVWADREYYRLFTAPVLHIDVWHWLGNVALLLAIGPWVERTLGRAEYLGVMIAGALGGALVGGMLSPYDYIVGSSGMLAALLGTALVVQVTRGSWLSIYDRVAFSDLLMIAMAIVALQIIYEFAGYNIDHYSHAGGLIAGLVVTMALYRRPQPGTSPEHSV